MKTRLILIALSALVVLLALPGIASAYRFEVMKPGGNTSLRINDVDPTKDYTIRLVRGSDEQFRDDGGPGTDQTLNSLNIQVGDVVQIFQPAIADPTPDPAPAPTAAFTVPNLTISASAGSPVVSGTGPDGWTAFTNALPACGGPSDVRSAPIVGGAWSTSFATPAAAAQQFSVRAYSPNGDSIGTWNQISVRIPGDAGCITADASDDGDDFASKPFSVYTSGLDTVVVPTVRIVLRRGSTVLAEANNDEVDLTRANKPAPGDVIDVYRPKDAATPAYSWTIPKIGASFDTGSNLVAVDAPMAAEIGIGVCRPVYCGFYSERVATDLPAGRTLFDFAVPQSYYRARALHTDDSIDGWWISSDLRYFYSFEAVAGDLTSPNGKISLAKSIDAKKLKSRVKFEMTSNEAGSAAFTLSAAAAKKGKKAIKLGSTEGAVKVGSNKITLKLSKSGKKAVKGIVKGGKSRKATLTVTLTDAAGNVTTVVKSTTLKVKKPKRRR